MLLVLIFRSVPLSSKMGEPFDFSKRMYVDMINGYASQPIEEHYALVLSGKWMRSDDYYQGCVRPRLKHDLRRSIYR